MQACRERTGSFQVLEEMPDWDLQYKVLLWKKNRKKTLVVMEWEDAEEILMMLKRETL